MEVLVDEEKNDGKKGKNEYRWEGKLIGKVRKEGKERRVRRRRRKG